MTNKVYCFSPGMEQLRRECIVDPIRVDSRTQWPELPLGYPSHAVRSEIIDTGRAVFDEPYAGDSGVLSPGDRVALYAYQYQPGHLFEMLWYLERFLANVTDDRIAQMHFLDIGCGPMTAGLALAQHVGARVPIDYVGIDISRAMLDKAHHLARYARDTRLLHEDSNIRFAESLAEVGHGPRTWKPLVVILSFLLASRTLQIGQLVEELMEYSTRLGPGSVSVIYTNSTEEIANRRFPQFQAALERHAFTLHAHGNEEDIRYRLPSGERTRRLRYALFHRSEQTTLIV